MTRNSFETTNLERTIKEGKFFTLSDKSLLHEIGEAFGPELDRLKNVPASEPGSLEYVNTKYCMERTSPSHQLFDIAYDEVNRTLVGMLALRWIWNDAYETFVHGQASSVRLGRESFKWLRDLFLASLRTSDDVLALVTAMVINDLGKDASLEKEVTSVTHKQGLNHDMVLLEAAIHDMVPSLRRLDHLHQTDLMLGLKLGSELNAGQLAQAENVLGNLEVLLEMSQHRRAFDLKFMEQLLDVAGAAGHVDGSCAKKLVEPVLQSFKTVHEVAVEIMDGNTSLRDGYDKVLTRRGDVLSGKGFRALSKDYPVDRALLRLLSMGRTCDRAQAELFDQAFCSLPETVRRGIVDGLNVDGLNDGIAILPYYMPAMSAEGLDNTADSPPDIKRKALSSLMRFLAKVFEGTRPEPNTKGVVIEKNLLFARETIRGVRFKEDPTVLDALDVPAGAVLKGARI